ncbi:MAG: 4Fe-4S binding protein [Cellulosilyticaceae bacterium]
MKKNTKKSIANYLWIASALYLILGMFNILFAWLGMLCFIIPLVISVVKKNKSYCNYYCGRGQLFEILGKKLKISRYKPMPKWMKHNAFRYGFLAFFMIMFFNMIFNTFLVFQGKETVQEVITLLWTFKLPWHMADLSTVTPWVVQFAYGFYSMMVTSTILGLVTMILFKPRSWCVYCPMGTMTQGICVCMRKMTENVENK